MSKKRSINELYEYILSKREELSKITGTSDAEQTKKKRLESLIRGREKELGKENLIRFEMADLLGKPYADNIEETELPQDKNVAKKFTELKEKLESEKKKNLGIIKQLEYNGKSIEFFESLMKEYGTDEKDDDIAKMLDFLKRRNTTLFKSLSNDYKLRFEMAKLLEVTYSDEIEKGNYKIENFDEHAIIYQLDDAQKDEFQRMRSELLNYMGKTDYSRDSDIAKSSTKPKVAKKEEEAPASKDSDLTKSEGKYLFQLGFIKSGLVTFLSWIKKILRLKPDSKMYAGIEKLENIVIASSRYNGVSIENEGKDKAAESIKESEKKSEKKPGETSEKETAGKTQEKSTGQSDGKPKSKGDGTPRKENAGKTQEKSTGQSGGKPKSKGGRTQKKETAGKTPENAARKPDEKPNSKGGGTPGKGNAGKTPENAARKPDEKPKSKDDGTPGKGNAGKTPENAAGQSGGNPKPKDDGTQKKEAARNENNTSKKSPKYIPPYVSAIDVSAMKWLRNEIKYVRDKAGASNSEKWIANRGESIVQKTNNKCVSVEPRKIMKFYNIPEVPGWGDRQTIIMYMMVGEIYRKAEELGVSITDVNGEIRKIEDIYSVVCLNLNTPEIAKKAQEGTRNQENETARQKNAYQK